MKKVEKNSKKEEHKSVVIPLKRVEIKTLALLKESYNALLSLSEARLQSKLSNTRVTRVAKELNELLKVMSVYESA